MSVAHVSSKAVILFDLDGTLVDSATDLFRSMNLSLQELNLPLVTEEQVRVWVGKGTAIFCESVLKHITKQVDPVQHALLLETFLRIYNAEPCVNTKPFDGVVEFLDWAKTHGKTLVCVTNKPELPARKIIEELALSHYFVDVIGGDRFEQRKPHPKQLLHCVETCNVANERVLMVGDSSNDVEAARRANVDCVVVSYGYNHGEDIQNCHPQKIVDDLRELIA